jgi:hypothetical protein
MSGDYSRFRFKPTDDYSGVLMQQGRVLVDADWNEFVDLLDRHIRAETIDIIGRCVVPREPRDVDGVPLSFRIVANAGNLVIGRGRAYVDGLLAENHGNPLALEFDSSLAEQRGASTIPYGNQPYLPNPTPLPGGDTRHLVYLDVWQREVTPTQNPDLIEKAIGVDTATRLQTVWQVKVLANVGEDVACDTPPDRIRGWLDLTRRSAGLLTSGVVPGAVSTDPCIIAASGGYRGVENRLYRVEIHDPGVPGTATFKWSRANASIVSPVTAISGTRDEITVTRIGRDAVLRFANGDWVEITDDWHELNGRPGLMRKIDGDPDEVNLTLKLNQSLPVGEFDVLDPTRRHTRVILWNQRGIVRDTNGNVLTNLDAAGSTGLITVPNAAATSVVLEDGVIVSFDVDASVSENPAERRFHTADYWCFSARTIDGTVEPLVNAPPRGIHHHFCRLAIVIFAANRVIDCRTFWPPEVPHGGESCDCAACVTIESHQSGALTLHEAVRQVKDVGGKICVGPGTYILNEPLVIDDAQSLQIVGVGSKTILIHRGDGVEAAIQIRTSLDVTLQKMVVVSGSPGIEVERSISVRLWDLVILATGSGRRALGIVMHNYLGAKIERCIVVQTGDFLGIRSFGFGDKGSGAAIALAGVSFFTSIRDNVLIGSIGVAGATTAISPTTFGSALAANISRFLLTAQLEIKDNFCITPRRGLSFEGFVIHTAETKFVGNSINGCFEAGIIASGLVLPEVRGSHIDVEANTIRTLETGNGIIISMDDTRVNSNDIASLTPQRKDRITFDDPIRGRRARLQGTGNGIVLTPSFFQQTSKVAPFDIRTNIDRCQVLSNRIVGMSNYGVYIAPFAVVVTAMIKQNMIDAAGLGGIVMELGLLDTKFLNLSLAAAETKEAFNVVAAASASQAGMLVVENNQLLNIGGSTDEKEFRVLGISLGFTAQANIIGNGIGALGQAAQSTRHSGIEAVFCQSLQITNNQLLGIGPEQFLNQSFGLLVVRCRHADISSNLVRRLREGTEARKADWLALRVIGDPDTRKGIERDKLLLPRLRESVTVRGNFFESRSRAPSVLVAIGGACILTNNQCFLDSETAVKVVDITSGAAIVSNNYVEGIFATDSVAIDVSLPPDGFEAYTVVGNIASGFILVNGGVLSAPWKDLNRREF